MREWLLVARMEEFAKPGDCLTLRMNDDLDRMSLDGGASA